MTSPKAPSVERFDFTNSRDVEGQACDYGDYVRYSDYEKLQAENEKLREYERVAKDLSALLKRIDRWGVSCDPDVLKVKMIEVSPHIRRLVLPSSPLRNEALKETT